MKTTKENLQYHLDSLKKHNSMPEDIELIPSDGRLGRLIALGNYSENALYLKSDYMTYGEMNQFLNGYYLASNGRK